MPAKTSVDSLTRRALCIAQSSTYPLYVFTLRAEEVLRVADISRVSRDQTGKLIGYQRPEVRKHIQEIVDYLNADGAVFPNPIIMALSSRVHFKKIRGDRLPGDELGITGTLTIPLPRAGQAKPAWIVDGQQRALALSRMRQKDFPVPVTGFVADAVKVQRDQFLRINNTKPLPRGLVTELLPEVDSPLPPRLAIRRAPSELCDLLNTDERSPLRGMIRRASTAKAHAAHAVITDTGIVEMIKESLTSSGCLFPYRDVGRNETDFDGILHALYAYWAAVRDTFPDAWGKPADKSRLMHGAGVRAMGRLMDRILGIVDPRGEDAPQLIREQLALVAPCCHWTSGTWEGLNMRWNEVENTTRDANALSNYLIRVHRNAQAGLR
ncbi:DGQHR domain-containing protein [Dactylosporangium vinaceum]|uniref:DGQHR domain-containing protein DpdB n=1 Tax=Dactylosporangium vinaceum TaxID=53362 RepID=A0ABV5MLI2_9ACTN|nr:DGQHR domain-containing protein DpdB [Dactylosporangium vinaceum]UAB96967.1 DGQHR domain-containing protein [Dactylosporangium vinaceum]